MKKIRIDVPALPGNVRIIESFIDNSKKEFNLNNDLYGNIMLADEITFKEGGGIVELRLYINS